MSKIFWRGRYECRCAIDNVEQLVEPRLKAAGIIKNSIDLYQAGFSNSVAASAGTHDGGGVLDVAQFSTAALKIWRQCGWWMWHRTPAQGFMHHGHGVLNGCPHVSSGAAYQVREGIAGRNGLAGRGPDDGPRVPVPTHAQAMKNKPGGDSTPTPKPKEKSIMAGTIKKYGNGKKRTITNKKWHSLALTEEGAVSLAAGPANVMATVQIQADIPTGCTLAVRFYTVNYKKGATTKVVTTYAAAAEVVHTGGNTYLTVPYLDYIGKAPAGWSRRLRVQVIATGGNATIVKSWARVLIEKK